MQEVARTALRVCLSPERKVLWAVAHLQVRRWAVGLLHGGVPRAAKTVSLDIGSEASIGLSIMAANELNKLQCLVVRLQGLGMLLVIPEDGDPEPEIIRIDEQSDPFVNDICEPLADEAGRCEWIPPKYSAAFQLIIAAEFLRLFQIHDFPAMVKQLEQEAGMGTLRNLYRQLIVHVVVMTNRWNVSREDLIRGIAAVLQKIFRKGLFRALPSDWRG